MPIQFLTQALLFTSSGEMKNSYREAKWVGAAAKISYSKTISIFQSLLANYSWKWVGEGCEAKSFNSSSHRMLTRKMICFMMKIRCESASDVNRMGESTRGALHIFTSSTSAAPRDASLSWQSRQQEKKQRASGETKPIRFLHCFAVLFLVSWSCLSFTYL